MSVTRDRQAILKQRIARFRDDIRHAKEYGLTKDDVEFLIRHIERYEKELEHPNALKPYTEVCPRCKGAGYIRITG